VPGRQTKLSKEGLRTAKAELALTKARKEFRAAMEVLQASHAALSREAADKGAVVQALRLQAPPRPAPPRPWSHCSPGVVIARVLLAVDAHCILRCH